LKNKNLELMQELLVDKLYQLQKMEGKGGWTYTLIEEIPPDKKAKFGWVQVSGSIDNFELLRYKLMPWGNGKLFLPVRAEIRKKIKKQAGDWVHIQLYLDNTANEVPEEFLLCLEDDQEAKSFFETLSESEQQFYIKWIYEAKKDETKVSRIVNTLRNLVLKKKFYERVSDKE
jgi:hypothetical protein